jgi:hypothetical protein
MISRGFHQLVCPSFFAFPQEQWLVAVPCGFGNSRAAGPVDPRLGPSTGLAQPDDATLISAIVRRAPTLLESERGAIDGPSPYNDTLERGAMCGIAGVISGR